MQAPASTVAAAPTSAALSASRPERLRIPAIDVDARGGVIDLGLQADGSMEVPPNQHDGRLVQQVADAG